MPIKFRLGMLFGLMILVLMGQMNASAQLGRPDLFYLAPDGTGVIQVWSLSGSNTVTQLSTETISVVGYDIAPNNSLAYVTNRSLVVNGTPVTAGGALDSLNVNLHDVAWSPSGNRVAITAISPSGQADPSEGVWLYDVTGGVWTLALNSSRSDPANTTIYNEVEWATSGDRLILTVSFAPEINGVAIYSLSTGQVTPYNQAGTGGIIDPNGYSRGEMSREGNTIILSEVPNSPVGSGFIVDINDFARIVPLVGDEYSGRYLSHAIPINNGTAFFIRDFGNNVTSSEVWQLSTAGARVALGSIPHAQLGFKADWSTDGMFLAYVNDPDATTQLGILNVYTRAGEVMEAVQLPPEVVTAFDPKWGAVINAASLTQVTDIIVTEPLIEFLDETGTRYFTVRMQWNAVSGSTRYRVTIQPGFDGLTTFDVDTNAAKINRLPCTNTFTVSVAAYDASGVAGAESIPLNVTMPRCDTALAPVVTDLYANAAAPVATDPNVAPPPATDPNAAPPPATDPNAVQPAPIATEDLAGGPAAGGDTAAQVTDLTAGLPIQEGTLANGSPAYYTDLSWTAPASVQFFWILVNPPFGDNQRDRVQARFDGTSPIVARVAGLACGQNYSISIQSTGADGFESLAVSQPVTVSTPFCQ